MGLRDIIDRITGGGSSRDSSPSSGSRDRDSIQSQINAEQARIGQGQCKLYFPINVYSSGWGCVSTDYFPRILISVAMNLPGCM